MRENKERAIIFIDGSNFYHLLKESGIDPRCINFQKFSTKLIMDRILVDTLFYVAPVDRVEVPLEYKKQRQFFAKLIKWGVKIRYGRLETRLIVCNQCKNQLYCDTCKKTMVVKKEKGVDVLLAAEMIHYALDDKYDLAYLVSGDGDFSPAVEIVRNIAHKKSVQCNSI